MEEQEKNELVDKILNVDKDAKVARVATTVFINKATQDDARYFVDYLDHHDPAVKKIARSIVGQKNIFEALPLLIQEFYSAVGSLNFMPDEEYKEAHYYPNLIEILETIFTLCRTQCIKDNDFYKWIVQIFKKTKNEDLRFTLIKLLGLMGGQFDYFMEIYENLTEKERRALYYVYTIVEEPRRLELYKKGLNDHRNFEYMVSNILKFEEGRGALGEALLSLSSLKKQTVLKKLQETSGKYTEFNDLLIKLLNDKNKFLVVLAIENLKSSLSSAFSPQPFCEIIEGGYSPQGIRGALEIIAHFVKNDPEDIYLSGLEKQASHQNKKVILEFFIEQLKNNIKQTWELTEKILPKLLLFFDNYTREKEEFFISIFKIIITLKFSSGIEIKGVKKKIVEFKQEFEKRFSNTFNNKLVELMVKLNHKATRFEEIESKLKNIKVLFDINPRKIDHDRMLKLKQQLEEVEDLDNETRSRLTQFLHTMYHVAKINWKIRTVAIELLGKYGGIEEIPILSQIIEKESSLAVKVNAQKSIKKIEEKYPAAIQSVLILEPLFYIQKKLNQFFKQRTFRVFNLKEVERFSEIISKSFRFLLISESLLTEEFTQEVFDYMDTHLDSILIVVTANPDNLHMFKEIPNVRFLKKPFSDDQILEIIALE